MFEQVFKLLTIFTPENKMVNVQKKTRKLSTHKWNSQQRRTHGDDDSGEVCVFFYALIFLILRFCLCFMRSGVCTDRAAANHLLI